MALILPKNATSVFTVQRCKLCGIKPWSLSWSVLHHDVKKIRFTFCARV